MGKAIGRGVYVIGVMYMYIIASSIDSVFILHLSLHLYIVRSMHPS